MQTTFGESAIRSTLPRLEDPLPLKEEEYEECSWSTPSRYLDVGCHELDDTQDLNVLPCTNPVSVSANDTWDNFDRVMEPGGSSAYLEYKKKFEALLYPKENVQIRSDENSDCDEEYSEEEDEEEKEEEEEGEEEGEEQTPPPKKSRTNNTSVINDEFSDCDPSPPVDQASLRAEFLASLAQWPAHLKSTPTNRKHFVALDSSVDHTAALDPKKVMCSGCKEYKTLDMRPEYNLTQWFAHRPRCTKLFNKWLASRSENVDYA